MPWYKLPHSALVMWFDQKMPDLKPARKPRVKHAKPAPKPKPEPKEEAEEHFHIHSPGGSAIVGTAEDVARQLAPHIGRKAE